MWQHVSMDRNLDADGSPGQCGPRLWPRVVAWTCFVSVVGASVWGVAGSASVDGTARLADNLMWSAILVAFAFVGAFIVQQRPDHRIGWLLLVPGLAAAGLVAQGVLAAPPDEVTVGVLLALWADNFSWLPAFFSIFLMLALFPSGRPINDRWRWHTWLTVGMGVVLLGWGFFAREVGSVDADWTVDNPVGFLPAIDDTAWFMPLWSAGLLTISVGALVAMIVRYRRADRVERQQLKWLLYAVTLFTLVYVSLVFLHDRMTTLLVDLMLGVVLLFIPLAVMIAIVRYRLFDIDVIIRRTLVYAVVSGLLAAIYVGSVVTFQTLLGDLAGVDSSLGVAGSTLLVVVLFAPVRRWTQTLVARRFFRSAYNAQTAAATFGTRARQLTDVTRLTDELVGVVDDTLRPRSVGVWLPPPGR